jgi:hypothetical protein
MHAPSPFRDARLFFKAGAVFGLFAALLGATPFNVAESAEPAAFSFGALLITPVLVGAGAATLSVLRNLFRKD